MECLLLGGAQSVGKSETIFRLAHSLVTAGYVIVAGTLPTTFTDFRIVLEGINNHGKSVRIIINSPTDTVDIINVFKNFYDSHGVYDILISSVRDNNFWPRRDFFRIMDISRPKDFILEIPLAKITRRGTNFNTSLTWYQLELDNTVKHIINNSPFNL